MQVRDPSTTGPMTMDLINKMRSAQSDLQAEWSMNYVERHYRERQYQELEAGYYQKMSNQKYHYTYLYMMLKYYQNGEQWPQYHLSMDTEDKVIRKRSIQFMSNERFKDEITKLNPEQRDLIDAVTFSTLPAFCHYFFTEIGISYFFDVLRACKEDSIYYSLARLPFTSPGFLNFVAAVFKPVLSHAIGKSEPTPKSELARQIKQAWRNNVHLIPRFVCRLLSDSEHPERVLSDSFFDIALTETSIRIYNMVEYYQTVGSNVLATLRDLLIHPGELSICEDLVHIIIHNENDSPYVLTVDNQEAVPALFQPCLLSWVDHNVFSSINIKGSFTDPLCYDVAMYMHEGDKEKDCVHREAEMTMCGNVTIEASLRHLLQGADPIPVFEDVPEGMTIGEFIMEYLVVRGARNTQNKRITAYTDLCQIKKHALWRDDREMLLALGRVVLDRTKEIQALSAFTAIQSKFEKMDMDSEPVRMNTMKLHDYLSLRKFFINKQMFSRSVDEYVTDCNKFNEDYEKLYHEYEDSAPLYMKTRDIWKQLIYGYLLQNFTDGFAKYRSRRQQIRDLDEMVSCYYMDHIDDYISRLYEPKANMQPDKFDERKCMRETIALIRERRDIIGVIAAASEESNPLRKLTEFLRGVGLAIQFFKDHFPPSEEFGADQTVPITLGFLACCHPSFIVSNWSYLKHFIDNVPLAGLSNPHLISNIYEIFRDHLGDVDVETL